jgi:hypothetical protein
MRLKSDFIDYYDHEFIGRGSDDYMLLRPSVNPEMPRERMFELLKESRLSVPFYSRNKADFVNRGISKVVVYTDELAHRGEGKRVCVINLLEDDQSLKAEFIDIDREFGSSSSRLLFIGHHAFLLGYRSSDSWRSNYGDDVSIDLISVTKNDRHEWRLSEELKKYPLLAIDSVISHNGDSCFVDLNTSPSWRHTWLEELLHPAVVYKFMEEYVNETLS